MCSIFYATNRAGIGATLGAIGAQLPYPYVHLVYWTIQVVLVALSIETGVILAADTFFKRNGEYFLNVCVNALAMFLCTIYCLYLVILCVLD